MAKKTAKPTDSATQDQKPPESTAAAAPASISLDDCRIEWSYPMGLTCGTASLPDGSTITATRVGRPQVMEALARKLAGEDPDAVPAPALTAQVPPAGENGQA